MYPEVPAVFVDTGLEYPEIRDFVKTVDNVVQLKPKLNFRQVIEKHGYPIVSKEVSETIDQCRKGYKSRFKKIDPNYKGRFKCQNWAFLMDAPFKISNLCCYEMKKKPVKSFEKKNNLKPFVGTMATESALRRLSWQKNGCNSFNTPRPISQPLSFWTEQDIFEYIDTFKTPYCSVYGKIMLESFDRGKTYRYCTGVKRTGCMFCMFGVHLEKEPNRFQRMQKTHPKMHDYCTKDWDKGGLGLAKVLEYIRVPYKDYIPQLKDYEQMSIFRKGESS
jgi:3'-phosphoadenosine 5'-phosphosulfate sulfotransferase (PAPS reductase)/FAD synthetase